MTDIEMTSIEARRRYDQLAKDFEQRHPAKWEASRFVNVLVDAARIPDGVVSTRLGRERERAAAELHVRYNVLCDAFESASIELEGYLFDTLLKIMRATYELGIHAAPDGRHAREKHSDKSGAKAHAVEAAVRIYLESHPELKLRVSANFANLIHPAILELLGLPKDAKRPAVSALVTALRAIRKSSLIL